MKLSLSSSSIPLGLVFVAASACDRTNDSSPSKTSVTSAPVAAPPANPSSVESLARRRFVSSILAPLAIASGLLVWLAPKPAQAQVYVVERDRDWSRDRFTSALNLGFDGEGVADVAPPNVNQNGVEAGSGFKVRVGAQIHRRFLRIIPEGGFSYTHLFVTDAGGDNLGWNMERAFVGARIGFGEIVVPVVYGHVGYGWRDTTQGPVPASGGFAGDAGLALDLHLIPHFGFGFHAEYVAIDATPFVPDWLAFGLHADVAL
jgi:hypothetical protein